MGSRYKRYTADSGYIIPGTTVGTNMSNKEKEKIAAAFYEGKIKSIDDIKSYGAHRDAPEEDLIGWLKKLVDANQYVTGVYWDSIDIKDGKINLPKDKVFDSKVPVNSDYEALLDTAYKDRLGLMTDPNGKMAQNYKSTMYDAIERERSSLDETMGSAELDAYRMLGNQQLELESMIAEQRKAALRSGTTSAQLAAQQLQNMFAAQSGAAQVASGLMGTRIASQQQIGQQRTGVISGLYDYINSQQTIAATAGAQNMAALGSYASYANTMYNELMGAARAKKELGDDTYNSVIQKDR